MTAKNRRHALGAFIALADLGMPLSAVQRAAGVSFLQRHPSVDTHAHPGRFFLKNPVVRSCRDWSLIPAALLARGMRETEVASVMGGNFLRIFEANV